MEAAAGALRSPTAAAASPSRRVAALRGAGAGASSLPFERRRTFAFGFIKFLVLDAILRVSGGSSSLVGKFLSQILVTHPHLLPAAAEQQLEQLQANHDAAEKENGGDNMPAPPSAFLIGPKRQFDMMLDSVRIYAMAIYIVHSKLLTLLAIILEFGALVWYSLSYIPFFPSAWAFRLCE